MKWVFWIGVIWLGYVYVGYPLLLAALTAFRRVRPRVKDNDLPTVSVLIAARNEEKDIGWKVAETLRWDYPPDRLEILVASDASDDRTDGILRGIADPRLTFVRMERRCGKGVALNHLAELARGELLFFTDANAHITRDSLRRMVRHFADERVGCVTGDTYTIEDNNEPAVGSGASVYWGYESTVKRLENEIGSVLVCDGAIFCTRRCLYQPVLPEMANDLELPMRIAHAGYWILHEPQARVLERDTRSSSEEFARRRRICAQGMLAFWRISHTLGGLRGWQFLSHKFLRWLTAVPMGMLLVSTMTLRNSNPFFALLLWLQVAFYAAALVGFLLTLAGRRAGRLVSVPFYVLWGSLGTLTGVVDACLGRRYAVWEIPSLARGQQDQLAHGADASSDSSGPASQAETPSHVQKRSVG